MKIAIIGSGIGGLGAAVRLRAKGHEVTVFEANSYIGGKITEVHKGGYRFDAGPSLFTMPEYVTDLFKTAGKDPEEYFSYREVGESCRYFYPDGTSLIAYEDRDKFAAECKEKLDIEPEVIKNYLEKSEELYDITSHLFLDKSLHKLSTYLSKETFQSFLKVHKLELTKTMNRVNEKRLGHPKLVQMFNRFATYNGSNPYVAPGILNIIPHLEFNIGTYFADGGMINVAQSVYNLARDIGVRFELNSPVDEIAVYRKKVHGVVVNGKQLSFDRVVSNADIVPTYRNLLPNQKAPERTLRQERSTSAIIFYWGIKKQFDFLGLQNIYFSADYKKEFEYMFDRGDVYDDPTVYIHISSVLEPSDAPEGCANWFVMINAPHDTGQDWDELIARTRKNVLEKLSREMGEDIESLIEEESVLEPRIIEQRTASYQGSLYGASSNGLFASFIRHPNFSQKIKGLYFCGGSVHPGGGIPLCLISGKIVADLMK